MSNDQIGLVSGVVRRLIRLLREDSETAERLDRLHGRVICLQLATSTATVCIELGDPIKVSRACEGEPSVSLKGHLHDFVAYAQASRAGDAFGAGRIEISGDLAAAQELQRLLQTLNPDFDSWLARVVGDAAAHRVGRTVRAGLELATHQSRRLREDLVEYLMHELRLVPTRQEVATLTRQIHEVADAAERAAARLAKLRRRPC